jgi:hypothetical protein
VSQQPYREAAPPPVKPEWWEDGTPSEKEIELWLKFYKWFVASPRSYSCGENTGAAKLADSGMRDYIKRFGRIK